MNTITTAVSEPRPLADRILGEVWHSPECELDALALNLPELTYQDVVREVHRLSGTGQLQLSPWGAGIYTVRVTSEPGQEQTLRPLGSRVRPFVKCQQPRFLQTE